jgi:hypothetical protein
MNDKPSINMVKVSEKLRLAFLNILIEEKTEVGDDAKLTSTDILCLLTTLSFQLMASILRLEYSASNVKVIGMLLQAATEATATTLAKHAEETSDEHGAN